MTFGLSKNCPFEHVDIVVSTNAAQDHKLFYNLPVLADFHFGPQSIDLFLQGHVLVCETVIVMGGLMKSFYFIFEPHLLIIQVF